MTLFTHSLEHSSGLAYVAECESFHVLQNTLSPNVILYLNFVTRLRWMTKSEKKCSENNSTNADVFALDRCKYTEIRIQNRDDAKRKLALIK